MAEAKACKILDMATPIAKVKLQAAGMSIVQFLDRGESAMFVVDKGRYQIWDLAASAMICKLQHHDLQLKLPYAIECNDLDQ